MCDGLAEARSDGVQDDIDQVVVSYLGIDIESIDIVQVLLDSPYLLDRTDLIKSPVQLVMLAVVFPFGILYFFSGSILVPICFPLFQCFSSCAQTNVCGL